MYGNGLGRINSSGCKQSRASTGIRNAVACGVVDEWKNPTVSGFYVKLVKRSQRVAHGRSGRRSCCTWRRHLGPSCQPHLHAHDSPTPFVPPTIRSLARGSESLHNGRAVLALLAYSGPEHSPPQPVASVRHRRIVWLECLSCVPSYDMMHRRIRRPSAAASATIRENHQDSRG